MHGGYSYVLSEAACTIAFQLPAREQRRIASLCRRLADDPFRPGDYNIFDEAGRSVQNLLMDDWVFTYWSDHAVKEVRILEIVQV